MTKMSAYSCEGCSKAIDPLYFCDGIYGHKDVRYLSDFLGHFTLRRHEICQAFELGFKPKQMIPYLIKSLKREAEVSGRVIRDIKRSYALGSVPRTKQGEIDFYMNNGKQAKELLKMLLEDFNKFFEALPSEDNCTYRRIGQPVNL